MSSPRHSQSTVELSPEALQAQVQAAEAASRLQQELWSNMQRVALDQMWFFLRSQIAELVFRLGVLSVGTFFGFLGYRLFLAGFVTPANMEAKGGGYALSLGQAAPGIFFALFGTIMIVVGISRLLPVPKLQQPEISYSPKTPAGSPEESL